MAKRDKYHPDYQKLYPGVDLDTEVMRVLMQSDRKMRYLEVDIKRGKFLRESAAFIPTREDSLDRLQDEEGTVFTSPMPSPEETTVHNDEVARLREALKLLKPEEYALIHAVFYEEITEKTLAEKAGITQQGISKRLKAIYRKIRKMMKN